MKRPLGNHRETPMEHAARELGYPWSREVRPVSALAAFVLNNFSVQRLGEDLAFDALCDIICDVPFPSASARDAIVSKAERHLRSLIGLSPGHRFRENDVQALRNMRVIEGKSFQEMRTILGE